jgi:hypothetical protein
MRRIIFTGPPPVQIVDVTGPLEVFSSVADYSVVIATPGEGRQLTTNRGVALASAIPIHEIIGPINTLIIAGGPGAEGGEYDPVFLKWNRRGQMIDTSRMGLKEIADAADSGRRTQCAVPSSASSLSPRASMRSDSRGPSTRWLACAAPESARDRCAGLNRSKLSCESYGRN